MPVVVRNAEPADLHGLTALMYEYIVYFYERPKSPVEKLHNLIHILLDGTQGIQFVAQQNGILVGFATLYFSYSTTKSDKITILNDLYVIEEVRGKEVASELFKSCLHYSRDHGYAHMSWVTAAENKRAQRFYEKMGGIRGDWLNYLIL